MDAAAILGPLRYPAKAHLYTTASKDLTQQLSLLFPAAANWPFASAVVRELLGGSKGADSGNSEGSAKQEFTTQSVVEAEAEGPDEEQVQNFRVLQLLSAAQSQLQGHEVGPRVAPILQHLIPELRSLTPVELAALCKALSDIAWQDSLVDLVLGVVSESSPFSTVSCPHNSPCHAFDKHADVTLPCSHSIPQSAAVWCTELLHSKVLA